MGKMHSPSLVLSLSFPSYVKVVLSYRGDLADMQLLAWVKMETAQKVFGQGLLMASIYHFDMSMAKRLVCPACLCKCANMHVFV